MNEKPFKTIVKRLNGDSVSPILLFRRLKGERKFLIEGTNSEGQKNQYTIIGMNPVKGFQMKNGCLLQKDYVNGFETELSIPMMEALREAIPATKVDLDFPFCGGYIGYFSYEGVQFYSPVGNDDIQIEPMQMDFYDTVFLYDHMKDEIICIHNEIERTYEEANVDQYIAAIFEEQLVEETNYELSDFNSYYSDEQFMELVKKTQEEISKRNLVQVVISNRYQANFQGNPFTMYRELRKETPAPYMFYFEYPDFSMMGVSPESIFNVNGNQIKVAPVTGARPRGKTAREDVQIELTLLQNVNEVKAHNMLVDSTTEDLMRICQPKTVFMTEYMKPVLFRHSIRLTSEVSGELLPKIHIVDAFSTMLPPASSTGVPKFDAAKLIGEMEEVRRSFYGGVVGYFSLNGFVNFTLLMQSMLIKENRAFIQSGANVLKDSDCEIALIEVKRKIKAFIAIEEKRSVVQY